MDWLPELTDDDLTTMMEALEAWETKDAASEMFTEVVELIVGDTPAGRARVRGPEMAAQKLQREREKTVRKERSVLLRAKLLTLRERRRVERTVGWGDKREKAD